MTILKYLKLLALSLTSAETLAVELNSAADESEKYDAKIEGKLVEISLKKA